MTMTTDPGPGAGRKNTPTAITRRPLPMMSSFRNPPLPPDTWIRRYRSWNRFPGGCSLSSCQFFVSLWSIAVPRRGVLFGDPLYPSICRMEPLPTVEDLVPILRSHGIELPPGVVGTSAVGQLSSGMAHCSIGERHTGHAFPGIAGASAASRVKPCRSFAARSRC